jgi:hypothetical protein
MKLLLGAAVVAVIAAPIAEARPRIDLTAVATVRQHPRLPLGRAGDVETDRWSLRDRHGRTIGTGYLNCRWPGRSRRLCYGVLDLPLGTIAVQGLSETRSAGVFAVVGGTERYERAAGSLLFNETGARRLTISILL